MKKLAALPLATLLALSACGPTGGLPDIHAGDEVSWTEPGSGGSEEPVTHTATVTGWDGTWIECADGKRLEASTFESLEVSCPHE